MPYIDKINVGGTDYDIGGGGHVIEDASGTELTQRDTLQIAGTLKATDDDTNEKTVISDAAEEVEWSVWNAMTEAERDEYSAGKKIDIVNVPGADGTISADLMTLLWTNTSTEATFGPQTVNLDLSSYDSVIIDFRATVPSQIIPVGMSLAVTFSSISTSNAAYVYERGVSVSNTGVVFDAGYLHSAGSAKVADNRLIQPHRIYGIKKTINLKINAIASDVSTSASKCMMSDGETSVESIWRTVSVPTINNKWSDLCPLINLLKKRHISGLSIEITSSTYTIILNDMWHRWAGTAGTDGILLMSNAGFYAIGPSTVNLYRWTSPGTAEDCTNQSIFVSPTVPTSIRAHFIEYAE